MLMRLLLLLLLACLFCSSVSRASMEVRLLLSSLRYLDQIVNAESLATQLNECVNHMTDIDFQREVIAAVPEIMGANAAQGVNTQHTDQASADSEGRTFFLSLFLTSFLSLVVFLFLLQTMVDTLLSLRDDVPAVTAVVLDTLLALSMDAETQAEVVEKLLGNLNSKPPQEFPATVGFILQASGGTMQQAHEGKAKDAKAKFMETLGKLRYAINHSQIIAFSAAVSSSMRGEGAAGAGARRANRAVAASQRNRGGGGGAAAAASSSNADSDTAAPFLVLEALRQAFRHHPGIAEGWLKLLQSVKGQVRKILHTHTRARSIHRATAFSFVSFHSL